mgnify:CR=1 FL=1
MISIIHILAPLLLITLGALISEYSGRLSMFMEGIINLGAFLCYTFTVITNNVIAGLSLSVLTSTLFIFLVELLASRQNANMFLLSLALNLILGSVITLLSVTIFGTRGVLYSPSFLFDASKARIITTVLCYIFSALVIFMLLYTRPGLTFRVTGSDPDVLLAKGISPSLYRSLSWVIASFSGSLGGAVLCIRLSSFVPGLSSGRGWISLAAVYLGRKNPILIILAVAVFAVAEYASSHIQNIQFFSAVPSSVLLALPYLLALVMIIVWNKK